jgi:hypothetical protein
MQRPEHEVVALGEGARNVLSDETFNTLFKEYTDLSLSAIANSAPHETKLREFEYAKLQAIKGFAEYLASFVEAAHNITNPPQQSEED